MNFAFKAWIAPADHVQNGAAATYTGSPVWCQPWIHFLSNQFQD